MKRTLAVLVLLLLADAGGVLAHDLFLRLASFFVAPHTRVHIYVLNGTFSESQARLTWDRVADLTVLTPAERSYPDSSSWQSRGDTTVLEVRTGGEGTYVVGLSTRPRALQLNAKQFNEYLAADGVPDILAARRMRGELDLPARERYSKHVKAIVQVGTRRTDTFGTTLGYPAELVPLDQPYSLPVPGVIRVSVLVNGAPVANQYVIAGGRDRRGGRIAQQTTRSDADGVARISLRTRGHWYVKFIHMVPVREDSVDYESRWATLTFEVR